MSAKIYCPASSATQSAPGDGVVWVLRFDAESPRVIDPLMGWTSSSDMKSQIKLRFSTKEEAIAYAERNGLAYRVEEPKPVIPRGRAYADNFNPDRMELWTH